MATSKPIFKINKSAPTEVEFEVSMQGIDTDESIVRLVLETGVSDLLYTIPCTLAPNRKTKWCARIPVIPAFADETGTYDFSIEVVVEGYYFKAATGTYGFNVAPTVKLESTAPSVTATVITVANGDPEPVADDTSTTDGMRPDVDVADDYIEVDRLNPPVTTAVSDPAPSPTAPVFDPKQVAATIIKNRIGTSPKTATKGELFARNKDGKPVIKGLPVDANEARKRQQNDNAVRSILSSDE